MPGPTLQESEEITLFLLFFCLDGDVYRLPDKLTFGNTLLSSIRTTSLFVPLVCDSLVFLCAQSLYVSCISCMPLLYRIEKG